ncbi:MAG: hypothetical protein HQK51_21045 [Oligoflexia bacterium]|nr:hypothetical protein [Oligoflexia bacterium]
MKKVIDCTFLKIILFTIITFQLSFSNLAYASNSSTASPGQGIISDLKYTEADSTNLSGIDNDGTKGLPLTMFIMSLFVLLVSVIQMMVASITLYRDGNNSTDDTCFSTADIVTTTKNLLFLIIFDLALFYEFKSSVGKKQDELANVLRANDPQNDIQEISLRGMYQITKLQRDYLAYYLFGFLLSVITDIVTSIMTIVESYYKDLNKEYCLGVVWKKNSKIPGKNMTFGWMLVIKILITMFSTGGGVGKSLTGWFDNPDKANALMVRKGENSATMKSEDGTTINADWGDASDMQETARGIDGGLQILGILLTILGKVLDRNREVVGAVTDVPGGVGEAAKNARATKSAGMVALFLLPIIALNSIIITYYSKLLNQYGARLRSIMCIYYRLTAGTAPVTAGQLTSVQQYDFASSDNKCDWIERYNSCEGQGCEAEKAMYNALVDKLKQPLGKTTTEIRSTMFQNINEGFYKNVFAYLNDLLFKKSYAKDVNLNESKNDSNFSVPICINKNDQKNLIDLECKSKENDRFYFGIKDITKKFEHIPEARKIINEPAFKKISEEVDLYLYKKKSFNDVDNKEKELQRLLKIAESGKGILKQVIIHYASKKDKKTEYDKKLLEYSDFDKLEKSIFQDTVKTISKNKNLLKEIEKKDKNFGMVDVLSAGVMDHALTKTNLEEKKAKFVKEISKNVNEQKTINDQIKNEQSAVIQSDSSSETDKIKTKQTVFTFKTIETKTEKDIFDLISIRYLKSYDKLAIFPENIDTND